MSSDVELSADLDPGYDPRLALPVVHAAVDDVLGHAALRGMFDEPQEKVSKLVLICNISNSFCFKGVSENIDAPVKARKFDNRPNSHQFSLCLLLASPCKPQEDEETDLIENESKVKAERCLKDALGRTYPTTQAAQQAINKVMTLMGKKLKRKNGKSNRTVFACDSAFLKNGHFNPQAQCTCIIYFRKRGEGVWIVDANTSIFHHHPYCISVAKPTQKEMNAGIDAGLGNIPHATGATLMSSLATQHIIVQTATEKRRMYRANEKRRQINAADEACDFNLIPAFVEQVRVLASFIVPSLSCNFPVAQN